MQAPNPDTDAEAEAKATARFEPRDDVTSLEDANQVVGEQGMALRIQPKAPAPTRYYFTENGSWQKQIAGHRHPTTVDVESVRAAVKRAIPKNDRKGGGGVTAAPRSEVTRYA